MLEPSQFDVNEAWILFQLNEVPISTETDGDFNVVCLMDAGSCYILGNEFVPTHLAGFPESAAERLIQAGKSQAKALPQKFLLSSELHPGQLTERAQLFGVEVELVSDDQLSPFVSEAREGFRAHIGGGRMQ